MGLVLKSDYEDYYDDAFERDLWGTNNTKLVRLKDYHTPWKKLEEMTKANDTPHYGYPEGLLYENVPQDTLVTVYTSIHKNLTETMSLQEAAEKYPNCLCVEIVENEVEGIDHYSLLSIGMHFIWLIYYKDGKIEVGKELTEDSEDNYKIYVYADYLIHSIDYKVAKGNILAVDFVTNPILKETILPQIFKPEDVVKSLEKAICLKSMQLKN